MQIYSNTAISSLESNINATITTISVKQTDGGLFSNPGIMDYELITITDGTVWEVVKMVSRTDNTMTVVRGFEGVAREWPAGSVVKSSITKATLDEFMQRKQIGATLNLFAYQNFR